jgi:hypothetical protein
MHISDKTYYPSMSNVGYCIEMGLNCFLVPLNPRNFFGNFRKKILPAVFGSQFGLNFRLKIWHYVRSNVDIQIADRQNVHKMTENVDFI